jgi:hypothetical protein
MEPEGSSPYSIYPPLLPILSQLDPDHTPSSHFLKIYLKYYPRIYAWFSQVVSFPQVFPTKPCIRLSSTPYALHTPPISLGFGIYHSDLALGKWKVIRNADK